MYMEYKCFGIRCSKLGYISSGLERLRRQTYSMRQPQNMAGETIKVFQSSFENDFVFFRVHSDSEVWPSEGLGILHCISEKPPQLESTSLQWLQKLWERKDHGLRWWMPVYGIWRRQNKTNGQILSSDIRPSSISWYVCLFVLLDMCSFIIKLPWQVALSPVMLNDSIMTGISDESLIRW